MQQLHSMFLKVRYLFLKNDNTFNSIAKPNHQAIKMLLNLLGNPQQNMKYIHVAGTNGKGSVCAYLQSILTDAGYVTGKFISPHMIDERERISINGENICVNDFEMIMDKVKAAQQRIEAESEMKLTQFELWCACAFICFKEKNCDYVVLEIGLGGRQDATNVIDEPVLSVITRIALDHTELLGNTLVEIAREKCGIIKERKCYGHTITVEQNNDVLKLIKSYAQKKKNKCTIVTSPSKSVFTDGCEFFSYKDLPYVKSRMLGGYQKENASCAIECALALGIDKRYILSGIYNAKNPGRFEILSKKPLIVFDGAHNQNGIESMAKTLNKYFPGNKFNFIIAFMHGKNIIDSINTIKSIVCPDNMRFYAVEIKNNPRSEKSSVIYDILTNEGFEAYDAKTLKNALDTVVFKDRITVICGSLYLYSDFFDVFNSQD